MAAWFLWTSQWLNGRNSQHGFLDRVYNETAVKLPFQLMVLMML